MPDLTINYAHAWDTIKKGIDDKGPYYQISYWFDDYSQSDTVLNQLMGYTARVGDLTQRIPPHQFPLSPNLYCTDATCDPCGVPILNSAGQISVTGGFFVHATYRGSSMIIQQSQQDPGNDHQIDPTTPIVWATQELDFETETVYFEDHQFVWWATGDNTNNTKTGIPLKVTIGITTLVITFHKLPYLPMSLVRSKRGRVNSTTFLGAPAETVLFLGARTIREYSTDGSIVQKVSLTFKERDNSWNKFPHKQTIAWHYIQDSGGTRAYLTTDLNPLIQI